MFTGVGGEPDTGRCPTCDDRPISRGSYCARCDRYPDIDFLVHKIQADERRAARPRKTAATKPAKAPTRRQRRQAVSSAVSP